MRVSVTQRRRIVTVAQPKRRPPASDAECALGDAPKPKPLVDSDAAKVDV